MPWNAQYATDRRSPKGSLTELLDAIRLDQEERWQVSAEYYRTAMSDLTLIRWAILGLFLIECAERLFAGG